MEGREFVLASFFFLIAPQDKHFCDRECAWFNFFKEEAVISKEADSQILRESQSVQIEGEESHAKVDDLASMFESCSRPFGL